MVSGNHTGISGCTLACGIPSLRSVRYGGEPCDECRVARSAVCGCLDLAISLNGI